MLMKPATGFAYHICCVCFFLPMSGLVHGRNLVKSNWRKTTAYTCVPITLWYLVDEPPPKKKPKYSH